jgi:hypothetical protein
MRTKTLPALFSFLIIAATVNGQIKKGALFLGGQLGVSGQTTKNENSPDLKSTGITFSPAFGKAVKDNLIIGFDINYGHTKVQNYYPETQTSNAYGAGFFIRKYRELGKGFYLFAQGRAGGSYNNQEYKNSSQVPVDNKSNGYTIGIAVYPGVSYAITHKLQLETGFNNLAYLEFNHNEQSVNSNPYTKTNGISLGSSLSNFSGLTVGFRFILN